MSTKTYKGSKLVATETTSHRVYPQELYEYYLVKFLELGFTIEDSESMIDGTPDFRLADRMLGQGATHNQVTSILS